MLIANTYHELTAPEPILKALFALMRSGGMLVVVDRGPRDGDESPTAADPPEITATVAERDITRHGFRMVTRDDRFIDRPADHDVWWLIVFTKP